MNRVGVNMVGVKIFRAVRPYLTAAAVAVMVAILMAAIYFTSLELQWIAFLGGILVAAVLAMVSRASHAEWVIARRTAQLTRTRERFAEEQERNRIAEKALAAARADFDLVRVSLPTMFAYVGADRQYRFHNLAYRRWLGLEARQIDGREVRNVLPPERYAEIESSVELALTGRALSIERMQTGPDGGLHRLLAQYVPHFSAGSEVAGLFVVMTDLGPAESDEREVRRGAPPVPTGAAESASEAAQDLYVGSFAEELTGWPNAAERLQTALERDEFRLYAQSMLPLSAEGSPACEIFLRLAEEEQKLIPPGAFVPLAEQYGLMPSLDRWVVNHTIAWIAGRQAADPDGVLPVCFVNLAAATQCDPGFPEFVLNAITEARVPADSVCFEIAESDVLMREGDAAFVAQQLKRGGCRIALAGFGRDKVSFGILKSMPVDYLKIDGNVVLGMMRDKVKFARVHTISRVAHAVGIRSIAEYVESDDILAALRDMRVDYAQGFGISLPEPLHGLH